MTRQRLFVVYGTGKDAVGLVGSITAPISRAGGNIVDLRQDVLHGLFTIFLVVDLSQTEMRIEDLTEMVRKIGEDTGLGLAVEKYNPTPRDPNKINVLMILVGNDRPGIISSVSEILGSYNANIELAQSIGREEVFLTEFLIDVSHCSLPLENLQATVSKAMADIGIQAIFQCEDVFNKRKRVILFDIENSFIGPAMRAEICKQTGLSPVELAAEYSIGDVPGSLRKAASRLEGFPCEVLENIVSGVQPTPGTIELLQTLRTMGYTIALASNSFLPLTEMLSRRLGLCYAFGYPLPIEDDSQCVVGEIPPHELIERDMEKLVTDVMTAEQVSRDDVTVVSDEGMADTPGIRLELNLGQILDYFNKKIISRDALLGLMGSFGIPRE
jgi:predicted amino acid-binding ACT domain protein/phosphoserine phosphatase